MKNLFAILFASMVLFFSCNNNNTDITGPQKNNVVKPTTYNVTILFKDSTTHNYICSQVTYDSLTQSELNLYSGGSPVSIPLYQIINAHIIITP